MKDAINRNDPVVALHHGDVQRKQRKARHCAICTNRIWFDAVQVHEPEGAPEPRLAWTLCKECHGALLAEMKRSPVKSPLRMRIAIGLIASERSPYAYTSKAGEYISDHRWILFIAAGTFIAMILHLIIIVMIAGIK